MARDIYIVRAAQCILNNKLITYPVYKMKQLEDSNGLRHALNEASDLENRGPEPLLEKVAETHLPNTADEKLSEERKQAIVSYVSSMAAQDRLNSFEKLVDSIKESGIALEEDLHSVVQALSQNLYERDRKSAYLLKQLAQLGFLSPHNNSINPAGYYFVNEELKIVYCSIQKNACTLFKNMLVDNSNLKVKFDASDGNIHTFLNQQISNNSAIHLLNCLNSSEYFKLVILRNPARRIVSGYLDKIAKHVIPEVFAQEVISNVQTFLGLPINIEQSITFSQFIDYLVRTPDRLLNDHWRPQYNFVAAVNFDLVGQFEALDTVIETLEKNFNINIRKKVSSHITKYRHFGEDISFHSMYPHELRQLGGGMPVAEDFFTEELFQRFQPRYERDITLYNQHF